MDFRRLAGRRTAPLDLARDEPRLFLLRVRGCRDLDIVGGDLVEVSPPYDPHGNTALTAANLLFEMLCVLPGVVYR